MAINTTRLYHEIMEVPLYQASFSPTLLGSFLFHMEPEN